MVAALLLWRNHADIVRVQGGLRRLVNLSEAGSMDISEFLGWIILGMVSAGFIYAVFRALFHK
jgi:hypothetical protein